MIYECMFGVKYVVSLLSQHTNRGEFMDFIIGVIVGMVISYLIFVFTFKKKYDKFLEVKWALNELEEEGKIQRVEV